MGNFIVVFCKLNIFICHSSKYNDNLRHRLTTALKCKHKVPMTYFCLVQFFCSLKWCHLSLHPAFFKMMRCSIIGRVKGGDVRRLQKFMWIHFKICTSVVKNKSYNKLKFKVCRAVCSQLARHHCGRPQCGGAV